MSFIQLGGGLDSSGGGLSATLLSGRIYVGDAGNLADDVTPSGQVSMTNTGVFTLVGVTDGVAAAAGAIGERNSTETAIATTTGVAATTTWGSLGSILLQPGAWKLSAYFGFSENGSTMQNKAECGISTSANPGAIATLDAVSVPFQVSGGGDYLGAGPIKFIDIAAPTSYYLNTRFDYTAGTPAHFGKLVAERVR